MAKKITPTELKAELEAAPEASKVAAPGEIKIGVEMKSENLTALRKSFANRLSSDKQDGMRRVSLVPPLSFPGIDMPDGKGGSVTITPEPRLVSVATANALLAAARRKGNEFGLTEDKVRIEEEE